jgi:hypothetical protein
MREKKKEKKKEKPGSGVSCKMRVKIHNFVQNKNKTGMKKFELIDL